MFHKHIYTKKKKVKGIVPINVCVDPKYQNKGLFSKLSKKFEKIIIKRNFDFIIGVANKNVTHKWIKSIKMKFQFSLDAYIFFNLQKFSNFDTSTLNFYKLWDKKSFKWISQNPNNKIFSLKNNNYSILYANSIFEFLKVISVQKNLTNNTYLKKNSFLFLPKLFVGLKPSNQSFFKINVPQFLKPSPLNLIIKNLKNKKFKIEKSKTYFTFLDFDAF